EVSQGLRPVEVTEGVRLARYRDVWAAACDHLDEHARIRAALVQLAGRVQEARAEADRRGDVVAGAKSHARPSQRFDILRIAVEISGQGDVVTCSHGRKRFMDRKGPHLGLIAGEHPIGRVFCFLDVRLVEGVYPEYVTRDRGRELPAKELRAELVRV